MVDVVKEKVMDILEVSVPSLSSTSDMPVIETKPDAQMPKKEEVKEAPAAPDEGETISESATEHTEETPGEPAKKPPRGVQKRLDELTKREADALRLVDAERQEKLRLLAIIEKQGKQEPQPVEVKADQPVKPLRADFPEPEAYEAAMDKYIEDKSAWTVETKLAEAKVKETQEAQRKASEESQKTIQQAHATRVEKAKAKYADYAEVAEAPIEIPMPCAVAILNSEQGPDLAYYLGKNPAEIERLKALPPYRQLVEMGLIEAKLTAPVVEAQPEIKPSITQAPKPIKPLRAGSETAKSPENESMEEYAARRKSEMAKDARPGRTH